MKRRKLTELEIDIVEEIYQAWTVPGIAPSYHERMKDRVRMNMPILAKQLDGLEKARNTNRRFR